jgi:hypothetical protein
MPLGLFKTQFGGDISAVLLEDINRRMAASQARNCIQLFPTYCSFSASDMTL